MALIFALIPILLAGLLQPFLSFVPKALFSGAEPLPLVWPFIIVSILIKYLLIFILAGIPFFLFYLLSRRITCIKPKILKTIFLVVCLLFILSVFVPEAFNNDRTTLSTIKNINKICFGDTSCKNAVYGVIVKNGYYGSEKEKVQDGFSMPSLSSLRTDTVRNVFSSLSNPLREAYCQNTYGMITDIPAERTDLNNCREKLGLTNNENPIAEDCLAQTDPYSTPLQSLTDSCTKNFIKITPLDIESLRSFLSPNWQQRNDTYDVGYMGDYLTPKLTTIDNKILALISHLDDRQASYAINLTITQANPDLFQKYLGGSWSPVVGSNNNDRNPKQMSFEQKTISGQQAAEEHLQASGHPVLDIYRVGFVDKNIFLLIEAAGELPDSYYKTNGNSTEEVKNSAERLTQRIISFLSPSQSQNNTGVPATNQTGIFLASPSIINFSIKKGNIIEGSTKPEDFVTFNNNPFDAAALKSTHWKAVISGDWINAATNGTADLAYRVGLNIRAYELPVGSYSGTITYSGDLGSVLAPQTVTVNLTVTN